MNDWREYEALRHSWGKKPEQKKREKEYNHQYWLDHKEEIMRKRRQRAGNTGKESDYEERRKRLTSDKDEENYKGSDFSDVAGLNKRVALEVDDIEELIKANASLGGYSDDVMDNIRQHNQNIIDNITALTTRAEEYVKNNNLSGDALQEYMSKIKSQIDGQMNLALDLTNDSTHKYLEGLGAKRISGGSSSGSNSNSSSGSKSSGKKDDQSEYIFGMGDTKTSLSSKDRADIDKATKRVGNLAEADKKAREGLSGNTTSKKKTLSSKEEKKDRDADYYETMAEASKKRKEDKKNNRRAKHSAIDDDYLEHHGVKDQRWGVRNGPPYPLSSDVSTGKRLLKKIGDIRRERKEKKRIQKEKEIAERRRKKAEEEENAKQAIIKSGDMQMVTAAQSKLTMSEFREAVERCELNKRLSNTEITRTEFDKAVAKVKKGVGAAKTGVEAWNTFAQIYNTINENPVPRIDGTYYKNQNKKEEDKKDKKKDEAKHSAIDVYEEAVLAHHGILGQRWGKRNGPPYPLSAGDHSVSEKKAGWRKSLKTEYKEKKRNLLWKHEDENSKGYTDEDGKYSPQKEMDAIKRHQAERKALKEEYKKAKQADSKKLSEDREQIKKDLVRSFEQFLKTADDKDFDSFDAAAMYAFDNGFTPRDVNKIIGKKVYKE